MKIVIFIIDGVGDRPNKYGLTPLKEANTPNMDKLAEEGITGLMSAIDIGIRPGSDTAHLSILGYNPYKYYSGRGPLEALGVDIELKDGDVAFRCNFATVDENFTVVDRRAGRISEEEDKILEKEIDGIEIDGVKIIFKSSKGYRGALVLRGENLGDKVTDGDPHIEGKKVPEIKALNKESKKTAEVLNKLLKIVYEKLNNHPINEERRKKNLPVANIILPRGGGIYREVPKFYEKYNMRGLCICETGLIKGLAKMIGLDVEEVKVGDYDTIVKKLIDGLKKYDFILVNVKLANEASHDGDYNKKVKVLEDIDKMLGEIIKNINKDDVYFVLTGDHSSPIEVKDHSADPVPIVIWGKSVRVDDVKEFNEFSCYKGGLHWIKGEHVMKILLDLTNRCDKFGA